MKNILPLFITPLLLLACQLENKPSAAEAASCQLLSIEDFQKELGATDSPQLIDVRTQKEFSQGAIEGSKNIDFYGDDFLQRMTNELDKNKTVFVYCKSGGRSGKTCGKLSKNGFTKVYDLKGGYTAWAVKHNK